MRRHQRDGAIVFFIYIYSQYKKVERVKVINKIIIEKLKALRINKSRAPH